MNHPGMVLLTQSKENLFGQSPIHHSINCVLRTGLTVASMLKKTKWVVFFLFDLLWTDGRDLTGKTVA